MTRTQLGRHKRILETRLQELSNSLAKRGNIAVERAPDAVDALELAGERDLASWSLERHFAQLRCAEAALDRIADGIYGRCLRCDEEIGMKRLIALPQAVFCIRCQESAELSESRLPEDLKEWRVFRLALKILWPGLRNPVFCSEVVQDVCVHISLDS